MGRFWVLAAVLAAGCSVRRAEVGANPVSAAAVQEPPAVAAPSGEAGAWWRGLVRTGDELFVGASADRAMVFIANKHALAGAGGTRVLFVRIEYRDGAPASARLTQEIDCDGHRYRALALTGFAGRGLAGAVTPVAQGAAAWAYIAPGTEPEFAAALVCGAGERRRHAPARRKVAPPAEPGDTPEGLLNST